MDTVKNILKRIARRILKTELAVERYSFVQTIRTSQERASDAVGRAHRLERILREYREDQRKATLWLQKHSPANLEARALLESIGHATDSSFGVVHPFDRWGISPKP